MKDWRPGGVAWGHLRDLGGRGMAEQNPDRGVREGGMPADGKESRGRDGAGKTKGADEGAVRHEGSAATRAGSFPPSR